MGTLKTTEQRTVIQQHANWYTGRLLVDYEEGTGRAAAPPSPLLAVPNVHPSTASYQLH